MAHNESGVEFQRVVVRLLAAVFPDIKPLPPHKDGGSDAESALVGDRLFLCSLTNTLAKVRSDCGKHTDKDIRKVVFCTWPKVSGITQNKWRKVVAEEFGWELLVYEEESLLELALRQANCWVLDDEFGIPVPSDTLRPSSASDPGPLLSVEVQNALTRDRIELGVRQRELRDYDEALRVFHAALKECCDLLSSADQARIHTNIAATYYDLGDTAKAMDHSKLAIKLKPSDIRAYTNAAVIAHSTGDFAAACSLAEDGIAEVGATAYAVSIHAHSLWSMHQDDAALRRVEEAISIDPGCAHAHLIRGLMLRSRHAWPECLECLAEARRLDPANHYIHAVQLETQLFLSRSGESLIPWESADRESALLLHDVKGGGPVPRSLQSAAAVAHFARGLLMNMKGDTDGAILEYKQSLVYRDDPVCHQNIALACLKAGHEDEAEDATRAALAGGSEDPWVLHNLASLVVVRFQRGDFTDAALFDEAQGLLPRVKMTLGDLPEVRVLEALIIIVESRYRRRDTGLASARRLLDSVVRSMECEQSLSEKAFRNMSVAEDLEASFRMHPGR